MLALLSTPPPAPQAFSQAGGLQPDALHSSVAAVTAEQQASGAVGATQHSSAQLSTAFRKCTGTLLVYVPSRSWDCSGSLPPWRSAGRAWKPVA
jgi:hypothetical protein